MDTTRDKDAVVPPPGPYARPALRAVPADYFQLLKPRVMSLVVFTALTGLVIARTDGVSAHMNPFLAFVAILCIALGAGSAGALNMALEGKTDALMRRTRLRPVAAGRITRNDAMAFGGVLAVLSVFTMILTIGWLPGLLLALTIAYYVVFYTMILKRRTPQNIVIGGAAGAFPPVIGWAAATGHAPWQAWVLFAIIFLWTPPHSWALALYTTEDYANAGIPMMPVVRGAKSTRLQILLYAMVMAPVACLPALIGPEGNKMGGLAYAAVSVIGGLIFVWLAVRVFLSRAGDHPEGGESGLYDVKKEALAARNLFAFSILYLTLLFATLLLEHAFSGLHI
ncbi:MAG: heme o synthase [Asticcacaulis sp.]